MSRTRAELHAAMARQGCLEEQGATRIIARTPSPAGSDTYRSGWSRPPQLAAPRGVSPASSDTSTRSNKSNPSRLSVPLGSAMSRSDSAPCGRPDSSCNRMSPWSAADSHASRVRQRSRTPLVTKALSCEGVSVRARAQSIASDRSDASRPQDESVRSILSSEPSFMMSPGQSDSSTSDVKGLQHEGWLSKRTSHKLAARWQSRYWTLQGSVLRYHKQRGGPCLRSFDIRRVHRIEMPPGFTRELELDFGFRVWRLRAETPQAARRWLLLLEAARLVAGEPLAADCDDAENWSDDDSASSISTSDSVVSGSKNDQAVDRILSTTGSIDGSVSRSSTPTSNASTEVQRNGLALTTRAKGMLSSSVQALLPKSVPPSDLAPSKNTELLAAAAITDRLEVDPDDLDRRFDAWIKHDCAEEDTPHFGSTEATGVRNGLSTALTALWVAFGGEDPQTAVSSWKGSQMPEPQAFADAAESIIGEYLSRMLSRLGRWIQECDPCADEVADVAVWMIFDAKIALEQFETLASTELNSKPLTNWHVVANQIEVLLLGEWETRSCDELCQMVESSYTKNSASRALLGERGDESKHRVEAILNRVRMTLKNEVWRGHAAACDRALSVLIASLNAVLRSYRIYVQALLSLALPNGGKLSGNGAKWRLGKVLSRLSKHSSHCCDNPNALATLRISQTAIAMVAAEAAQLAEFCREAQSAKSPLVTADVSSDVLLAFSTAFEREEFQLCVILAEVFFAERHRQVLKEIAVGGIRHSRESHRNLPPPTAMVNWVRPMGSGNATQQLVTSCCVVAREFLEEIASNSASACRVQLSDAVIRRIVQSWIRSLRRGPPRLSLSTSEAVCSAITEDESALQELAVAYGASEKWSKCLASQDPLQPLREIRQIFEDSSSQKVVICAARLDVMLGTELGAAVATAVRFAITH